MSAKEHARGRLTSHDRFYTKTRLDGGDSHRRIAAALGRCASAISREVRRNCGRERYCPEATERRARGCRKAQAKRPAMNHAMSLVVCGLLRSYGWSPEAIRQRLRKVGGAAVPCAATIHKHIHEDRQVRRGSLYKCLPHKGRRAHPGAGVD